MIKYRFKSEDKEIKYSKNSFWKGVASIFNISGFGFNPEYKRSDIEAINSYWENVGNCFSNIIPKSNLEKKL